MRVEERWENQGRDRITLQEVLELHEGGLNLPLPMGISYRLPRKFS